VLGSEFEKEIFEHFCAAFAREEGAENFGLCFGDAVEEEGDREGFQVRVVVWVLRRGVGMRWGW